MIDHVGGADGGGAQLPQAGGPGQVGLLRRHCHRGLPPRHRRGRRRGALDPVWRDEVEHISHRHYSTGFYYGQPGQFTEDSRYIRDWQIVAKVLSCDGEGNALLTLNNKFSTRGRPGAGGPRRAPCVLPGGGAAGRGGQCGGAGAQAPDALHPETAPGGPAPVPSPAAGGPDAVT